MPPPAPAPAPEITLVIVHKTTREEKVVRVVGAVESRPIVIVNWTGCGDYALDLVKDELFGYGPGFGVRRTPTGWGIKDHTAARAIWQEKQREWRERNPVRTRAVRARQQKYRNLV